MKKIDKILEELGFNKNSSRGAQEAFIKHLLAHSGIQVVTPTEREALAQHPEKLKIFQNSEQLSFDFIEEKFPRPKKPKAVS